MRISLVLAAITALVMVTLSPGPVGATQGAVGDRTACEWAYIRGYYDFYFAGIAVFMSIEGVAMPAVLPQHDACYGAYVDGAAQGLQAAAQWTYGGPLTWSTYNRFWCYFDERYCRAGPAAGAGAGAVSQPTPTPALGSSAIPMPPQSAAASEQGPTPTPVPAPPIDPALLPAWELLTGITDRGLGNAFRDAQRLTGVRIIVGSLESSMVSVYSPSRNTITVDRSFLNEDPRALAAVLAHELVHAAQEAGGGLSRRTCVADEVEALLSQVLVWRLLWPSQPPSRTRLERQLTQVWRLYLLGGEPELYKLVVDEPGYQDQCRLIR